MKAYRPQRHPRSILGHRHSCSAPQPRETPIEYATLSARRVQSNPVRLGVRGPKVEAPRLTPKPGVPRIPPFRFAKVDNMSMRAARRLLFRSRERRRRCRTALACLAAGLVTIVTGHALAAESEEPEDIPDVVVTARPLRPDAVVVGEEEITSSPGGSLADVLHWSGVMDVYRRGSGSVQADPGFRASTFEQTGVFVDGVSVRDPQTGHFLLDLPIGRGQLEAVEVSPLAGGPDGLAGSVNLVLKTPAENSLELESRGGEHGLWRTGVAASTPGAGVWGAFEHSDGYRPGTDYDAGSVAALVTSEFLSSRTLVAWSSRRFGANDFYVNLPAFDEWEETETFLATWSGRAESGPWTIRPSLSYRQHRDHFLLDRYGRSSYENEHSSDTWGGQVAFEREVAGGLFRASVEGRSASLDSSNLGERDWSAGGVSASLGTKGNALDVEVAIRADAHSRFSSELCPLASIRWRPSEELALRASVSRAFREPSFNELYYSDPQNVGNADLDVETAWNVQLAADLSALGARWTLSAFSRREDELIDWVRSPSTPPWRSMNMGEADVLGGEGRVTFGRSEGEASEKLSLSYGRLHRDADYGGLESKYALNFPEHRFEARASCRRGALRLSVRLGYFLRTDGQEYTLLDGGLSWALGRWTASLAVTNALDKDYQEVGGVPMPGSVLTGGLVCRF